VKDPTGLGGFTKSDCGGKCTTPTRLSTMRDSAPLWETRPDDMMDLTAVPTACVLRGGWKVECEGQIGSPSVYGAIYKVRMPETSASTLKPNGRYSGYAIAAKCMMSNPNNNKEMCLAQAASDLVASKVCPNFPLFIGAVAGCSVPIRSTHPVAKRSRSLGIPLPQVAYVMYSELADQDLFMWIKWPHKAQEWKAIYYQLFKAIGIVQSHLNIIHNDLHPGNVLLKSGIPLIHDFGESIVIQNGPISGVCAPFGTGISNWDPKKRFVDYKRICDMVRWAGMTTGMSAGSYAPPPEIVALFYRSLNAFDYVKYPNIIASNYNAVDMCRAVTELWNPATTGLYRPLRANVACNVACENEGVLDAGTCTVDQNKYPGVQCCQSALYTGCACAGNYVCVDE
jgi:hypothetical protein